MARINLNKANAGKFRLSVITVTGDTRTKMYLSWQKCHQQYYSDTKDETTQYAIIVDQTDMDAAYWTIREEYHKVMKPRMY